MSKLSDNLKKIKKKHWFVLFGLISFIVLWSILLSFIGPNEIIEMLGVKQSYLAMFLIAVFGGVSTFTSVSYITALLTFAIGGLNPLLLGLIAGTGLTISDSLFFYLGINGKRVLAGRAKKTADKFEGWIKEKPFWFAPLITYIYISILPLPNDILTLSMAFSGVKYKTIILSLWLGNITGTFVVAYLASVGISLLM